MKSKAWIEKFMQGVFFVAACASVLAVALICIFLFANGIPAMKEIGFGKFISGTMWKPKNEIFGIFPMIIGSIYVTAGAIIIGVPIGILTSVFMATPTGVIQTTCSPTAIFTLGTQTRMQSSPRR